MWVSAPCTRTSMRVADVHSRVGARAIDESERIAVDTCCQPSWTGMRARAQFTRIFALRCRDSDLVAQFRLLTSPRITLRAPSAAPSPRFVLTLPASPSRAHLSHVWMLAIFLSFAVMSMALFRAWLADFNAMVGRMALWSPSAC